MSALFGSIRTAGDRVASLARGHGPATILIVVLLFALLRYDGFYNRYNVSAILSSMDLLSIGLMAIGLTFVIASGEIDLSVAGTAVTASIVAALVVPTNSGLGVAAGVGLGVAVGLINGALVALLRLPSFIVTLAMLLALRGLSLIFAQRGRVPIDYSTGLVASYNTNLGGIVPVPFLAFLVVFALAVVAFNLTSFGVHVLSVGGNLEASKLMGLRSTRTRLAVFAISGALSGLAGVFLLAKTTTGNPLEAQGWELTAIAAVVLGGTLLTGGKGSVVSTLVGVSLLTLVFQILNYENGQGLTINSYWQNVIRGLFVLAIVVVQAQGLRGDRARRLRPST